MSDGLKTAIQEKLFQNENDFSRFQSLKCLTIQTIKLRRTEGNFRADFIFQLIHIQLP